MPDDAIERARRAVDDATGGRFKTLSDFTEALLSEEDPVAQDTLIGEAATLLHHFAAFASQQAPEGWRLVPVEPTPEMTDAARTAFLHDMRGRKLLKYLFEEDPSNVGGYGDVDAPIDVEIQNECAGENAAKVWSAMLDAAPSVTLGEVG